MQIEIGWWAIPFAVTIIGYLVSDWWYKRVAGSTDYIGNSIVALVSIAVWLIVSLVALLIYALAT